MAVPFSGLITPDGTISFNSPEGKNFIVTSAHLSYTEIKQAMRDIQTAMRAQDAAEAARLHTYLADLAAPAKKLVTASAGRVTVIDGEVFYDGEAIHNTLVDRILWTLQEGFDVQPMLLFLDDLMQSTSNRVVTQLYTFMEKARMGITEDGCLLAYKRVRADFLDIYSGTIDNTPGTVVEMKRVEVNDNPNETCSHGLHFCSMSYLPSYGAGEGNTIVIVKVKPSDVVSIPTDYNHAKARCCRYTVVAEYTGSDKDDLLATKPVWTARDWGVSDWGYTDDHADDSDEEHEACTRCGAWVPVDDLVEGVCEDCEVCGECHAAFDHDGACQCEDQCGGCGEPEAACVCEDEDILETFSPLTMLDPVFYETVAPPQPKMVDPVLDQMFGYYNAIDPAPDCCDEGRKTSEPDLIDAAHAQARQTTYYRDPFTGEFVPTAINDHTDSEDEG